MVTIHMRDGSLMKLDVRSRTEQWPYVTGEYEPASQHILTRLLPDGGIALDVGANVGLLTVPLGRRLQQLRGRLYAFEPVPENFARLVENVELNALADTVECYQLALGDSDGQIPFHREGTGTASTGNAVVALGRVVTEDGMQPTASAQMITLDGWNEQVRLQRCDLIKVDIEGYEYEFLRGAIRFVETLRPIIYGEFNRYFLTQFGHSFTCLRTCWNHMGTLRWRSNGGVSYPLGGRMVWRTSCWFHASACLPSTM